MFSCAHQSAKELWQHLRMLRKLTGTPCRAQNLCFPVFFGLGLNVGGLWTDHAEMVVWREQPRVSSLDISNDPVFVSSVQQVIDTCPIDFREEAKLAFDILHDPRAVQKWCAIVARLYPEHLEFTQR